MLNKMKKNILVAVLLVGCIFTLVGCGGSSKEMKTSTIKNDDPKGKVSISYDKESKYKFYNGEKDGKDNFRSYLDEATLIGDDFQIGINFEEPFGGKTFKEKKESAKSDDQFKEVEFNGISGYSIYKASYIRYEVYLPIKDTNNYVVISVYSGTKDKPKDNEKAVKKTFKSDKVKDILNTIEISE